MRVRPLVELGENFFKADMMHMVIVMEHDKMGNTRVDGTEIRLTCGSLAKTSELIRSLRDDEQVKPQEQGSANRCALMSRASGRS